MNRKTGILVITLAAATAFAQTASVGQNSNNAKAPVAKQANAAASASSHGQATKPSAAASAKASSPSTPAVSTAAPVQKKAAAPAKSAASKPTVAQAKTSSAAKASAKQASAPVAKAAPKVKATKGGEKQNAGKKAEKSADSDQPNDDEKKYSMTGKRDPFLSPVVNHMGGSGCSTGKKCLEIGQIALKGVVHGEAGFIAVVTNTLNKAYFLRENDPVFNGYVVKITGDSIIFKETYQDRLGKSFTREVTKKITTPAV